MASSEKILHAMEMPARTMANLYWGLFINMDVKLRSEELKYTFFDAFSARMTLGSR